MVAYETKDTITLVKHKLIFYNTSLSAANMVRLASIEHNGETKLVAQTGDGTTYVDLTSIAPHARAFFELGDEALKKLKDMLVNADNIPEIPASDAILRIPLDPATCGKFLCIGMNYEDHCLEQNLPLPPEPVVFNKFNSALCGPNDPVVCDANLTSKLDYEVELGFIIGKTVPRNIEANDAEQYIGGYTVVHDVSARDWQLERNGGQWLLGKCQDSFGPIGPVIVTRDELPLDQVHNLKIACRVNGEVLQDSNTSQLVHKVDQIVSWLSKFMTLYPGDVVCTGTPPGVGCFRKPPRWLQPGDIVECEIEKIGTLVSPIVSTLAPSSASSALSRSSKGRLEGRVCIITGGARGIGYGIAAHFGLEGASVVVIVDLDSQVVDEGAKKLQSICPTCTFQGISCDVTNTEAVKTTWDHVVATHGRLEVVVQAAGIVGETNLKCENVNPDNFDAVMNVNVKGIFNGCKAALPHMTKQNFGRVVNIASISGKEGNAGMLAYSTSKAAVIGLTKAVGKEYAETGITVNAVAPAVVRTQMVEDMPLAQVKYMTDKIPMRRCGRIEEIAALVSFIASPEASFTTGFCFDASGGRATY